MSASERMLKLMAYADGELDGREREEVEAWLAADATAARFTNELATLGDLVQLGHAGSADGKAVASFDIADLVMAEVAKTDASTQASASPRGPAEVSSLEAARARRQKSVRWGAAAAAALTLAASIFLVQRTRDEQPMAQGPVRAASQGLGAVNANGSGIDVDVDEAPGRSVSVFYVPNETMSTTTSVIVWVDESGGE